MNKYFFKNNSLITLIIALAVSFLIYGNGIKGGFVFDDTAVIEKRGDLKNFGNFFNLFVSPYHQNTPQSGLYRPLTMASYALNYKIFGLGPASFHIINIIIHALNSFLVFWLINFLFRKTKLAYFSFFLFLTHPIHTEAVTSIVGRAELLAFFWSFVAVYFWSKKQRMLSATSFLLALWSKESALTILPIIFFMDWAVFGSKFWLSVRNLRSYAVPIVIYSIFRFVTLGKYFVSESVTTAVENPLKFATFGERIATAFKILFLYLEKLTWPVHLSADYSYNIIKLVSPVFKSVESLAGLAFFALPILLMTYRKTRGTTLGLGAALFLLPYLLVSNLVFPIGTIMGERLMYFSSAGFVVLIAFFLHKISGANKVGNIAALAIVVAATALFSIRTIDRNRDWWDNRSLFEAALAESPDGLLTRTSMAAVHIRNNEWAEAERELAVAQKIYPDNSHELNLLGIIADYKGDIIKAEELYKKSIELGDNPNTHINLANLYLRRGRYEEAGEQLLKVIEFNPVSEYVIRYGYVQITLNKPDVAIETINRYYAGRITTADLNAVLGTAHFVKKDFKRAVGYLEEAKRLGKPNQEIESMITISKEQLNISGN